MIKRILFFGLAIGALCMSMPASARQKSYLPDSICVKGQEMHVQGIAIDTARRCMYFSFTNRLLKTDLQGHILGSVDQLEGHLGAIALNPDDGLLYASLECKNDEIGAGIARKMNFQVSPETRSVFYIAIFRPDKINRPGENPQDSSVMQTVCIKEAVADYGTQVTNGGRKVLHRYGCSGIDGVMFAPPIGEGDSATRLLYIGYGIYGDDSRTDNDYQVLLCYRPAALKRYARSVNWKQPHASGPDKPLRKYFIRTGNTRYGIQNMTYDATTGMAFLAVYRGGKKAYPNYPLFTFEVKQKPQHTRLVGMEPPEKARTLALCRMGSFSQGIYGWQFPWGSTGICTTGDGRFYFAESGKDADGTHTCKARLYRFTGKPESVFAPSTDHE